MSRALRVLVVDDEPLARRRVKDLVTRAPGVDVAGSAATGPQAIAALEAHRLAGAPIDIVFLDVQMPGMSGLDVVREVGSAMPETVFVTAHEQHALAAFDAAAADYLLKPYDDERFAQALGRACRAARIAENPAAPLAPEAPVFRERFAVEVRGQTALVPVAEVTHIVSDGPYAELHTSGGVHVIRETMQALDDVLDPTVFARIHRSTIVHLGCVEAMVTAPGGSYSVRLRGGVTLAVSRSRRSDLVERLSAVPPA